MTSIPQCTYCKYFKNNISFCEKYKEIPQKVINGIELCKMHKKLEKKN